MELRKFEEWEVNEGAIDIGYKENIMEYRKNTFLFIEKGVVFLIGK